MFVTNAGNTLRQNKAKALSEWLDIEVSYIVVCFVAYNNLCSLTCFTTVLTQFVLGSEIITTHNSESAVYWFFFVSFGENVKNFPVDSFFKHL